MTLRILTVYTYTYMNSTIYIRKENEARWGALGDKSAWVNEMLSRVAPLPNGVEDPVYSLDASKGTSVTTIIPDSTPVKQQIKFCKNGHLIPVGSFRCSTKGCKYA